MCFQHLCLSSTLWLNSGYHIIKSYFWLRANFELKYLRPQMGYRKVMVCPRKLCSSRFRNTLYFYSYLNSKGFYGLPNVTSTFFVDTLYLLYWILSVTYFVVVKDIILLSGQSNFTMFIRMAHKKILNWFPQNHALHLFSLIETFWSYDPSRTYVCVLNVHFRFVCLLPVLLLL